MNNEVIKAMDRKKKDHVFRNWWNHHAWKALLFPVWLVYVKREKVCEKLNEREIWHDERAKEIFDYYIPRNSYWDEKTKTFYFFDNGYGWNMSFTKRHIKIKDRRFWNVHRGFGGGQLRDYLINKYELDGFKKQIGNCSDGYTEVSFKLIDLAKESV